MNKLKEKKLIGLIRTEYKMRLLEALESVQINEFDIEDKRGNQLISPGLKIKHKESGYEYTVDKIEGEGDDTKVHLKLPDEPRFEPPPAISSLNEIDVDMKNVRLKAAMGTDEEKSKVKVTVNKEDDNEETTIVVTKKELEKDYEVD